MKTFLKSDSLWMVYICQPLGILQEKTLMKYRNHFKSANETSMTNSVPWKNQEKRRLMADTSQSGCNAQAPATH